ncbi:MAG: hypothetical protein WC717_02520 [Candidatus Micrarchaeia archaeon]|jgi:hypothetical protein
MYLLDICGTDNMVGLLGTMVGTGAATMVVLLALFYMAANLFKRSGGESFVGTLGMVGKPSEYEAFVSTELYQLAVSLIIFSFVFGASCFADQLAASLAGGGNDAFWVANSYLQYIWEDVALDAVEKFQALVLLAQWTSSITMRFGASVWGIIIPVFPAMSVVERTVEFLLMMMSPFTASIIVQQVGLQVIKGVMLPFVLPMGVVLRMFPPTRDAGSYFISTALAFQVIFPFSYVMHAHIVKDILIPAAYESPEQFTDVMNSYGAGDVAAYITDYGVFDINKMLFHPLLAVSFLLLQAVFLPALSITLAVAFIKGFNKFISQKFG